MAMEYVNRKGDTYYLQQGKTRTGKPNYYFAKRLKAAGLDEIPDGYELYECPETAKVYVRKVRVTAISPMERELLEEAIVRLAGIEHALVDVEADALVVHLSNTEDESLDETCEVFGVRPHMLGRAREYLLRRANYQKMMRFTLVDADERLFTTERWCFRGSIDDWLPIGRPELLERALERFVPHLGKESFFELMRGF